MKQRNIATIRDMVMAPDAYIVLYLYKETNEIGNYGRAAYVPEEEHNKVG
jgi:hypothetical protein